MIGPEPPQFLTQADWQAVSQLLRPLWMIMGAGLGMALSFLIAHGVIPSMAATRDIPARMAAMPQTMLRAPFYAAAIAFLLFGLFSVYLLVERLHIVSEIFWRGPQ